MSFRVKRQGVLMSADEVDAVEFYDPSANNYDLGKDPRCLWGWGNPGDRFGHACFLPLGHDGKCRDGHDRSQRPKNWDAVGRSEANA